MNPLYRISALLLGASSLFSVNANAIESLRLTDTIKQGIGKIDLLQDIPPEQLETYRLDNQIVLAADINENSKGLEKSTSQGVAIKDIALILGYKDGTSKAYTLADGHVSTETQSWVMEKGDPERRPYYTLLGDSGSSRITAANRIQATFDSTIRIKVPDDLRGVTSAILSVTLLTTDSAQGDPEAFYDFSGGFEDLAILVPEDAAYLNKVAPGRLDAPIVELTQPIGDPSVPSNPTTPLDAATVQSWNYFPSADTFYIAAYEDLYPNVGDYDFNDLVVAYQVKHGLNADNKVVAIGGTAYILARGAMYSHDWHLRLPLPNAIKGKLSCTVTLQHPKYEGPCSARNPAEFSGTIDVTIFGDTVKIFSDPKGASSMLNTHSGRPPVTGPRGVFLIVLAEPADPSTLGPAPFDPYLYVRNTGKNIQLLEVNPDFKDANGNPFGMLMPSEKWRWPLEQEKITTAYPAFAKFVESRGQNAVDWFASEVPEKVFDQLPAPSVWAW